MIGLMTVSFLMCLATVAGGLGLLFVLARINARRYDTVLASDVLDDWQLHLALLDPAHREGARLSPPPGVLAAMAFLPSKGWAALFRL